MKAWSEWHAEVQLFVAGCAVPVIDQALRIAAQEFFDRTRAWRSVMEGFAIEVGEPIIDVVPDEQGAEIVRVERAALGALDLPWLSLDEAAEYFGPDWATQTGTPEAVTSATPNKLRVVPYPADEAPSDMLNLVVSLRPGVSSSGLPDELYFQYRQAVSNGACARLMLIPGQAWTQPEMAAMFAARFDEAIAAARIAASRGHGRGRPVTQVVWC